jgi:hypothetical protein
MWNWTGGHAFFHALTKYATAQAELRGMTPGEFDALRVHLMRRGERAPYDLGMTLGQLRSKHRDDEALEVVDPRTGHEHAVLDVDKQLREGIIVFTVDEASSPR